MNKILLKKTLSLFFLSFMLSFPFLVGAGFDTDISGDLKNSGLSDSTIYDILFTLMKWLLMIITVLAVIGFIVSGIFFITAGGSNRTEEAKSWLTYSFIGIIVALLGYIVIFLVNSILHGDPTQNLTP